MVANSVTVVFDGTCGFCTRSVRYLHRLDRSGRVTSVACQVAQQDPSHPLVEVDCGASAWALTPDGHKAAGAQAATMIAAVLLQRSWPATVGRFPGIRHVLDWGYHVIARNRHHLPGDTPWCTAHEGACGAA